LSLEEGSEEERLEISHATTTTKEEDSRTIIVLLHSRTTVLTKPIKDAPNITLPMLQRA